MHSVAELDNDDKARAQLSVIHSAESQNIDVESFVNMKQEAEEEY